MIIINGSGEAILRSTFVSVELKDVRGLPVKLRLASVVKVTFFIDYMWDSIHFTTKRFLLKYKIALFHKYILFLLEICQIQLLLGSLRGELYKELCVLEYLLRFAEVSEFASISSLTTASNSKWFMYRTYFVKLKFRWYFLMLQKFYLL